MCLNVCQVHLDSYASAGLRTLCLAYAEIEEESFEQVIQHLNVPRTFPECSPNVPRTLPVRAAKLSVP
jgi:hypothetical protein